ALRRRYPKLVCPCLSRSMCKAASKKASPRLKWLLRPNARARTRKGCGCLRLCGCLRKLSLRRSEEHTSELQSRFDLVCRLLLENAPPCTAMYPLSLHDALPICFETEVSEVGLSLPFAEHVQGGLKKGKPTPEMVAAAKRAGKDPEGLWMPASVRLLEEAILE